MTYKPWPTADQQQQEQGRTDVVGNFALNPATGQPYDSSNPMPVGATLTPPANQRVNAQSGDFVAGAITDLATLLTLAGTPTDANTIASLMGRLTKIRDLLTATLTVQGTITEANSAASKTDLDTIVTNTGKIPALPATEGGNLATLAGIVSSSKAAVKAAAGDMVDLATIAAAITASKMQSNVAQIGGQTPTLDNATIQAMSMRGKGAGTAGDTALLLDALGQMTIEQFIQYQIMQGHGFSATTGQVATNAANAFVCTQLAVNNISKKALIYSINIGNSAGAESDGRLYLANAATADSALTTALTAVNTQPKSATVTALTTLTGSPASTTQTSGFQGTQAAGWAATANANYEVLANGKFIYFANGDTASLEVAQKKVTSGNSCSISIAWIEW